MSYYRTGTAAVVICRVSVELVLGQEWAVLYQYVWYYDNSELCSISRTGTRAVVD